MSRTQSILRRPSTVTESNPPFYPSPQWLSESPARPPTSTPATPYIDHPRKEPPRVQGTPASHQYLRSPVPPPPANLHKDPPAAFSVDPGIPFLATAGPTDAGSDNGSIRDEPPKSSKLGSSIVSGLKKAVGSLKRGPLSSRSPTSGYGNYVPPPPLTPRRDSGYGDSTPQLPAPTTFPGGQVPSTFLTSREDPTQHRPDFRTPHGHYPDPSMPPQHPPNTHAQPYSPFSRSSKSQRPTTFPGGQEHRTGPSTLPTSRDDPDFRTKAVGSLKRGPLSSRSPKSGYGNYVPAPPPPPMRNSGYGDSTPQLPAPTTFPGGQEHRLGPSTVPTSREDPTQHRPDFRTPHGYYPDPSMPPQHPPNTHAQPYSSSSRSSMSQRPQTPGHIMSPQQIFSPVSASVEYGSDYAQMDPQTPPPSEVSFNTYLGRMQEFVSKVASLPWVAPDRPTVDYYPERSRRRDEPKRAPQIAWHAPDFARPSFKVAPGVPDEESDAGTWDSWEEYQREGEETNRPILAITPHRGSQVDLGEEFGEAPPPLPANPPGFTPRYKTQSLYGANTPASSAAPPLPAQPPGFTPRYKAQSLYGANTPAGSMLPLSRMATPEQYRPPLPEFPPLPQDPPDKRPSPIVQPQPRYGADAVFRPPPVAASRASSRGYALYDPPMPRREEDSPRSSRNSATAAKAPSVRGPQDPSSPRQSYSGSHRASRRSTGPSNDSATRTGYVPYENAPAQGQYAPSTRSQRTSTPAAASGGAW